MSLSDNEIQKVVYHCLCSLIVSWSWCVLAHSHWSLIMTFVDIDVGLKGPSSLHFIKI